MQKKQILIDLSKLRHPMVGLGQIALNYGRWYRDNARNLPPELDITLLVPRSYMGAFGNDVHYLEAKKLYALFPELLPHFDLWHSIYQLSPFMPPRSVKEYILTVHDVNFIHEKSPFKQRKYCRRLQRQCNRASRITFISHFALEDTQRFIQLGNTPTEIIYNGVEQLTEGPQQAPATICQDGMADKPFLLAIGEMRAKKQFHTLLPMMDHLPEYRLLIAGNDHTPYGKHLRAQVAKHPNVQMLGIVTDAERRWLYSHCTALLFPSIAEGFGLPLIEAMQWGKPVFCSDKTSLPEIGGPHANYFTHFEPTYMADLVTKGLQGHTEEKAKAAQDYAASFSYKKHMNKYIQLYSANLL